MIWIGISGGVQPEWVDDLGRNGWTISPGILSLANYPREAALGPPGILREEVRLHYTCGGGEVALVCGV